jgi:hypothetical protein
LPEAEEAISMKDEQWDMVVTEPDGTENVSKVSVGVPDDGLIDGSDEAPGEPPNQEETEAALVYVIESDEELVAALRTKMGYSLPKFVGKVGAMAAGQVTLEVAGSSVPVVTAALAARKVLKTGNVHGQLQTLIKTGNLSEEAKMDAAYICGKKGAKAGKAMVSAVPGVSTAATVAFAGKGVVKKVRGTRHKHRREVATRILQRLQANDPHYRSIVLALFANQSDPPVWMFRLECCPPAYQSIAVNVLMGKIAST